MDFIYSSGGGREEDKVQNIASEILLCSVNKTLKT